ncbi:hypothetical protein Bca52824_047574 [Brassica carinata]|uniref:Neprosin PEP catalytic domain-containing protein n=1 Tax=Brassica carinata TaxID=52824 RepID=A0A8X7UQ33_BRACI|nr:hypothetical protein Bca52824_047574 [Brassica carinata]
MTLSSYNDEEQPENISQPWQMAGECPENTIPIKRITKEDLLRVDNIKNYGKKSNISRPYQLYKPTDIISDNNDHEYAIAYVNGGPYRRTKAQINVWIIGGKFGLGLNTIEAGLHVNPDLYGDANPHFFIYWTVSSHKLSDGYHKTGCYNLMCSGFVQINRRVSPGGLMWVPTKPQEIATRLPPLSLKPSKPLI